MVPREGHTFLLQISWCLGSFFNTYHNNNESSTNMSSVAIIHSCTLAPWSRTRIVFLFPYSQHLPGAKEFKLDKWKHCWCRRLCLRILSSEGCLERKKGTCSTLYSMVSRLCHSHDEKESFRTGWVEMSHLLVNSFIRIQIYLLKPLRGTEWSPQFIGYRFEGPESWSHSLLR
jgi:hypothetical protein